MTLIVEVLTETREMGPATAAEIAAGVGCSPAAARRLLEQLEQAGQVESDNYQRRSRVYMAVSGEG